MARTKKSPTKKNKSKATSNLLVGKKMYIVRDKLMKTIRKLQASTHHCIPRAAIYRLIREIIQDTYRKTSLRVQLKALEALQESAEMFLVGIFEDANLLASHANRITLRIRDMHLVFALRGAMEYYPEGVNPYYN